MAVEAAPEAFVEAGCVLRRIRQELRWFGASAATEEATGCREQPPLAPALDLPLRDLLAAEPGRFGCECPIGGCRSRLGLE